MIPFGGVLLMPRLIGTKTFGCEHQLGLKEGRHSSLRTRLPAHLVQVHAVSIQLGKPPPSQGCSTAHSSPEDSHTDNSRIAARLHRFTSAPVKIPVSSPGQQAGQTTHYTAEFHGTDPPGSNVKARAGQADDPRQPAQRHQGQIVPDRSGGLLVVME